MKELFSLTKMCIISLEVLLFGTMASITNFIASATGFLRMSDFSSHKVDLVAVILGFIGYLALFIFFAIKI